MEVMAPDRRFPHGNLLQIVQAFQADDMGAPPLLTPVQYDSGGITCSGDIALREVATMAGTSRKRSPPGSLSKKFYLGRSTVSI
jgi:hypothetical protein